jgi:pimeloyl-ACP methyl ester carboxylesterase
MRISLRLFCLADFTLTACEPGGDPSDTAPGGPIESFLEVADGTRLAVLDWGGTGPALVLLSDAGRTAHVYEDVAPHFKDRRTVIGITRRRVGRSDAPEGEFGVDELVADIITLLDSRGIEQADFVGHSFGCAELSHLALHYPERVRRAVFLDGGWDFYEVYNSGGWWDAWPEKPMVPADSASPQSVAAYFARTSGVLLPVSEVRAAHRFDDTGNLVRLSPNVGDMFRGMIRERLVPLDLASISVPVLTVRAVPDAIEDSFFPEFAAYEDEKKKPFHLRLLAFHDIIHP